MKRVVSLLLCMSVLSACASSGTAKLRLNDLGSRYWQGTYYLSVEGQPSSIQCDVDASYRILGDVLVRYKGQDAESLFERSADQAKIKALKQQCLDKSLALGL